MGVHRRHGYLRVRTMHRELQFPGEVGARGRRGAQGDARTWVESVRTSFKAREAWIWAVIVRGGEEWRSGGTWGEWGQWGQWDEWSSLETVALEGFFLIPAFF